MRADGIHFQSLRYISTTLATYVGETVTLRFDPRDMAEIRVFHKDKFLCSAICPELAGAAVLAPALLSVARRTRGLSRHIHQPGELTQDAFPLLLRAFVVTLEALTGPPATNLVQMLFEGACGHTHADRLWPDAFAGSGAPRRAACASC